MESLSLLYVCLLLFWVLDFGFMFVLVFLRVVERLLDLSLENILILRSPDSDEAVVFGVVHVRSVSISSRTFVLGWCADVVGGVLVDGVVWVLGLSELVVDVVFGVAFVCICRFGVCAMVV